jgi:hypothetical protein
LQALHFQRINPNLLTKAKVVEAIPKRNAILGPVW